MMSTPQGTPAYQGPGDTVPPEAKPGFKTSEAWLSATVSTALLSFGEAGLWPAAAVAIGYALSRSLAKFATR